MSLFDSNDDVTTYEAEMQERMEPVDMSTIPHLWEYDDVEADYRAEMDTDYWSEVEQGMYDDDPSPYAGDYSEM